jgi:hypothetical protein
MSPATQPMPELRVTLCRYIQGLLVKEDHLLSDTQYVAVSHVWGNSDYLAWQSIRGIEGEVYSSEEKKQFLEVQLPSIIGGEWFWMDILCLDQSAAGKPALVAVTQHIPTIFFRAVRTLVIRDSFGLRECYATALGDISPTVDWTSKLIVHEVFAHKGWNLREGILDRLWPLQEICLSDSLQFVRCEVAPPPDETTVLGRSHVANYLHDSLNKLAMSWASVYGSERKNPSFSRDRINFINAYIHNGTVTRSRNGDVE